MLHKKSCRAGFFLILMLLYQQALANYDEIIRSREEQLLIEKLLKNYNKQLRPPGGIQVKFALNLYHIIRLIEKDQIMVINAFIDHEWTDKRLVWSKRVYNFKHHQQIFIFFKYFKLIYLQILQSTTI